MTLAFLYQHQPATRRALAQQPFPVIPGMEAVPVAHIAIVFQHRKLSSEMLESLLSDRQIKA